MQADFNILRSLYESSKWKTKWWKLRVWMNANALDAEYNVNLVNKGIFTLSESNGDLPWILRKYMCFIFLLSLVKD